jgi:hypothetical protein
MKVAVIIEPRAHPAFEFVVNNVLSVLGPSWLVQIFHGTKNKAFVSRVFAGHISSGRVELVNTNRDNFVSRPPELCQYSQYMCSLEFWNKVKGEHVLIFQTDSILIPGSTTKIDEFLEFDYIGAPWKWHNGRVGCGGLSLRKKSSAIYALTHSPPKNRNGGEDCYYSDYFRRSPIHKLADTESARRFCVGSMFHPMPLGVHKCWGPGHMKGAELAKFVKLFPAVAKLISLQKSPQNASKAKPKRITRKRIGLRKLPNPTKLTKPTIAKRRKTVRTTATKRKRKSAVVRRILRRRK